MAQRATSLGPKPSLFYLFLFFLFLFFLLFFVSLSLLLLEKKTLFSPPKKGIFVYFFCVSLCFSFALFHFLLFLCLSLSLFFFLVSFLSVFVISVSGSCFSFLFSLLFSFKLFFGFCCSGSCFVLSSIIIFHLFLLCIFCLPFLLVFGFACFVFLYFLILGKLSKTSSKNGYCKNSKNEKCRKKGHLHKSS